MITIVAGILMLGILVFVHELGHFAVAKISGVKVLKFSLGFGPRLISRKWGDTEYMVCAVPLGGYVQMLGEGISEEGEASEMTPEERKRSFADQSVGRRTAIVAAGPFMNLLLPFIILPLAFLVGVQVPSFLESEPCIGYVAPQSDGARAGFVSGDCITAINEKEVETWTEANHTLIAHAGAALEFTVRRDGSTTVLSMDPENGAVEGLQALGLLPSQEAEIGSLAPGMPAQAAGMEVGDRIVSIGGETIDSWYDLKQAIQNSEGEALEFQIMRGDEKLTLNIQPEAHEANGTDYLIGIAPHQETEFKRFGPIESIRAGAERTFELVKLTLIFIQKMFAGHVSAKNIGGPITVVQIAGQAAQTDFASILMVLAFLSIQLGILNLLPIPILDGGHLFFNVYEMIFRRPLSLRAREFAQQIGLILLLLLMILAFYNDIVRIFLGGQ